MPKNDPFSTLPFELVLKLLNELDIEDIFAVRKCNHQLRNFCRTPQVWTLIAARLHDRGISLPIRSFQTSVEELARSAMLALELQHEWAQPVAKVERILFLENTLPDAHVSLISSNLLVFCSFSEPLRIWDVERNEEVFKFPEYGKWEVGLRVLHTFVNVDERAWHLVFLDEELEPDFENSTSEVKLLKVQFAEAPAGGRALVTSSDVISLAVFPAALNISEVQVLSAAKRKICLLLSPKFSRRDHEFQTDVLFYIPDWLTDERLYGDTDLDLFITNNGCLWDPASGNIILDSQDKRVVTESRECFVVPVSELSAPSAELLSGDLRNSKIPRISLKPIANQSKSLNNQPLLPKIEFVRDNIIRQSPRQWFSSPWLTTRTTHHIVARMNEVSLIRRKPRMYLRYNFLSVKDVTETRSCELFTPLVDGTYPWDSGSDCGCIVWIDAAARYTPLKEQSLKLIQLAGQAVLEESVSGSGRALLRPPGVCILECPPELLGRVVQRMWLDATYGRIIVKVTEGPDDPDIYRAIAVLHYI